MGLPSWWALATSMRDLQDRIRDIRSEGVRSSPENRDIWDNPSFHGPGDCEDIEEVLNSLAAEAAETDPVQAALREFGVIPAPGFEAKLQSGVYGERSLENRIIDLSLIAAYAKAAEASDRFGTVLMRRSDKNRSHAGADLLPSRFRVVRVSEMGRGDLIHRPNIIVIDGSAPTGQLQAIPAFSEGHLDSAMLAFVWAGVTNADEAEALDFMRLARGVNLSGKQEATSFADMLCVLLAYPDPVKTVTALRQVLGLPSRPATTLDQISGMGRAEEVLRRVVDDLDAWSRGEIVWNDMTRSVLLTGAPGTGKTFLARALAGSLDAHFEYGSVGTWSGKSSVEMVQNMRDAFQRARQKAPSVLFIDEIDSFCSRSTAAHNESYQRYMVNSLLTMLDPDSLEGVIILAATNDLDAVDEAVRREGRFDEVVEIAPPGLDGIASALAFHLPDVTYEDCRRRAGDFAGCNPSVIASATRVAKTRARQMKKPVDLDLVLEAVRKRSGREEARIFGFQTRFERDGAPGEPDLVAARLRNDTNT